MPIYTDAQRYRAIRDLGILSESDQARGDAIMESIPLALKDAVMDAEGFDAFADILVELMEAENNKPATSEVPHHVV